MKTFLGLMATVVLGVVSEQHVLFDFTKSRPDWFKYPKDLQAGPKGDNKTMPTYCVHYQHYIAGWVQTNFTNPEKGNNWEGYSVCDVGYPNVNNWLRMPFIERGEYNRIVIEVNI